MSRRRIACIVMLIAAVASIGPSVGGCSRGERAAATQYFCPMHPQVTSDKPGDCPICNMRLEPRTAPAALYVCPMHPQVTSDKPGDCPICNMRLEPRTAPAAPGSTATDSSAVSGLAPVNLPPGQRELAGIRTIAVVREPIARHIRTVGTVAVDETRVQHMHVKIAGYVEKLFINTTGQYVQRGQPALAIYSPELLANQEEFLRARAAAERFAGSPVPEVRRGGEDLLRAARRRLELFDVPPSFIAALESTNTVQRTVTLNAHASGYVTTKSVVEGQQVEPGMEVFTLADLSRVWVEASFYENEARLVQVGQAAKLELPFDPSLQFTGKVAYIQPVLDPATRTLGVRFEFANRDLVLKPAMYVNVILEMEAVTAIVVPDAAVLDSGTRQMVFVETAPDQFVPRLVRTGIRSDGRVEILAGLEPGERVVDRANFLLDSESRLRGALEDAGSGPSHAHEEKR